MGKHLIIRLGGNDEVFAIPIRPVYQIITCRKRIISIVCTCGIVSREIIHHPYVIHSYDLRITRNGSVRIMRKNWITFKAFPFLEILGESNANPFAFGMRFVFSTGIIEHDERIFLLSFDSILLVLHPINGAFVLREIFPPLSVLIVVTHQRLVFRFPLVRNGDVVFRGSYTDA